MIRYPYPANRVELSYDADGNAWWMCILDRRLESRGNGEPPDLGLPVVVTQDLRRRRQAA